MKYLCYDLGNQEQDNSVVVHLRGSAANVLLLDRENFGRYRLHRPFRYIGGLRRRTPVRLEIPRDGHWYLVVDCGGYKHRTYVDKVELLNSDEARAVSEVDTAHAGVKA